MHDRMKQLPALRGSETCLGGLPSLRPQARFRERLERAERLRGHYRGTTGHIAAGKRNRVKILNDDGSRGWLSRWYLGSFESHRRSRQARYEARWPRFHTLYLACVTEIYLIRAGR
jgi:hypothetical protein